ncbi:multidrug efflux RND transporter permease subunit [Verticiella sediminum]|uniref:Efflux pump membrane transporter n=1 Tax=Verticiella sediminum TaxID=1247510 RepID=A0A556AUN9_9BURK|nr:efflux RND transporter permease subunit [Verticiella sediminum]TSH96657.1 multidrug efflux RND transporter permease subunit [Verticiella sediminum]
MPQFFISRPVFAWVVALFIILAGVLAIPSLPVAQFPDVAPPSVEITATYPGASAETVDESVTSLIERELNGAQGLLYFESTSDSFGRATITATFEPGTDPDLAAVDVQNRIKRVESRLPQAVMTQGLNVEKASSNFLMVVAMHSPDGSVDAPTLADYTSRNILDELTRVPGVGKTQLFAAERAMRIWIDPVKLVGYNLSMGDVNSAISTQNTQVPAGAIGAMPVDMGQEITASIVVRGMLQTPEEFGQIVLRSNPDGSNVFLRDVARIEFGSESYQFGSRLNGRPAAAVGIQLATGANALNTATLVRERMEELQRFFPAGTGWEIPYDTSPFVKASIEKVVHTLVEAVVLVILVMFLFLQNFRYTLIPTIVVPIALLGTFAVMYLAGFSINVLTMFGMVLAIGILVDDAIVVVENVERIMAEEGLPPKQATRKAMRQISGAIIGITLVLSAVFLPLAFMGGSVGVIYRQFAIAMAVSIMFSGFLALSLTPSLCATLLKPVNQEQHAERKGFFGWFNRFFNKATHRYQNGVTRIVHRPKRFMLLYLVIVGFLAFSYMRLPSSFLPVEDQGYVITNVQLPAGATQARTSAAMEQMEEYFLKRPSVDKMVSILGFSFSGAGENAGLAFTTFKDWSERDTSAMDEGNMATGYFAQHIRDGEFFSLVPPAIPELGTASGFTFRLQDRAGLGHGALIDARNQLLMKANQHPVLAYARPEGLEDAPQIRLDIDREAAAAQGVPFSSIATTLSSALGSAIINDFANAGRMQRVIVQSEGERRMQPEDILRLNVLNSQGQPVPLATVAKVDWEIGPMGLVRYNGYPAIKIAGDAKPGFSTGDAMIAMEEIAAELPEGFGYEWTGQSLQERISGAQLPMLISLALLTVFMILAALYESWAIPFSVVLVVPLGLLGSVLAVTFVGMPNDVFFKVGLVTIIGLSSKNAILIVEFAKDIYAEGRGLLESTIEAARLRFRPILMTSLAFTMGVIPLALATGASAASQRALGVGVLGGMISGTFLAIFLVPVFFVAVLQLFRVKPKKIGHDEDEEQPPKQEEPKQGVHA